MPGQPKSFLYPGGRPYQTAGTEPSVSVIDMDAFERGWEALINEPDADCPRCGVQPMQMHKPDCPQRGRD